MTARETMRAYLELARVSNLPTCVTNVLVGCAIGAASIEAAVFPWTAFAALSAAVALLYVGGMVLNDAIDAPVDATERPERPIPSGRVPRGTAFALAAVALGAGAGAVAPFGARALLWSVTLAATIVLYDLVHKKAAASIVLMGACRGLVYAMSAFAITGSPDAMALGAAAGAMTLYIAMVTALARREHLARVSRSRVRLLLPLVPLLVAAFIPPAHPDRAVAAGLVVILWLGRSSLFLGSDPPRTKAAVMGWLAGICLIDAYTLTLLDQRGLAVIAATLFFVTWLGHRWIRGT